MTKKLSLFLLLLCAFFATAMADGFTPTKGEKYLIQCKKSSKYATYNSSSVVGESDATVVLSATSSPNGSYSLFYIDASDTYFTIRSVQDTTKYVYAINTNDANSNIGVTSLNKGATIGDSCLWTISAQSDGYNIIPKNGSYSWNVRGSYNSIEQIGQWSSNSTDDDTWYFKTASTYLSSIPDIATGYYTIACADDSRAKSIYNDFSLEANAAYDLTLQNKSGVGTTNNYIWYVETKTDEATLSKSISITNGQGSHIKVGGQNQAYSGTLYSYDTLHIGLYNSSDKSYYFTEGINGSNYKDDGTPNYALSDGTTPFVTTWAGQSSAADDRWVFTEVSNQDFYKVTITDPNISDFTLSDAYVSCGEEKAKNGGFLTTTDNMSSSNVMAANVGYYAGTVNVNTADKTISVTYALNDSLCSKAIKEANKILDKSGQLGYPATNSTAYTELYSAITTATSSKTADNMTALETKLAAFKTSTEDIVLPEDGKVYQIVAKFYDGSERPIYYGTFGETERFGINGINDIASADLVSSYFFCHKMTNASENTTFLFVNKDGKYLSYFDDGGYSGKQAGTDAYASADNDWVLSRATISGNGGSASNVTDADFFGLLQMTQGGNYLTPRIHSNSSADSTFVSATSTKYYDTNSTTTRTFVYLFKEVSTETFAALKTTESGKTTIGGSDAYIGTYSTPFPVAKPENVDFYAPTVNSDNNKLLLGNALSFSDNIVPENVGFIVASTSVANLNPTPATGTEATVTSALTATKGETLATGTNAYVLGKPESGDLAFYLVSSTESERAIAPFKAYYVATGSNAEAAVALDFGGVVSGISAISSSSADAQAPIYDLQGRRVMKATKGLYIIGGKKVVK